MEQIGTKIQSLRKSKNLTQAQLAEILAVSPQSVSKWETHLSAPDICLLPVIARYFGITMDELFNYRLDALNCKERFIRFMADNGVLQFGAFRLRSGRLSPYYINTGNYKSASQISKLGQFYAECIREHNIDANVLIGNTPREIPIMLATSLTLFNRYGIDMHYSIDRCAGKPLCPGDSTILIKDTLTSGNTLKANLEALKDKSEIGAPHIIVSVDRKEKSAASPLTARKEIEREYGVHIHAIVTLDDIIQALDSGIIGCKEYAESLKLYKEQCGGEENGN